MAPFFEQSYSCGVDMPFAAFWKPLMQVYPNAKVFTIQITFTIVLTQWKVGFSAWKADFSAENLFSIHTFSGVVSRSSKFYNDTRPNHLITSDL